MKPMPIKWKLSIMTFLILTTVIVVLSAVAYTEMKESLVKHADRTLKTMGEGILVIIQSGVAEQKITQEINAMTGMVNRKNLRYRIEFQSMQGGPSTRTPIIHDDQGILAGEMPEKSPRMNDFVFFNLQPNECRVIWLRAESMGEIVDIRIADIGSYVHHEMGEYLRLLLILGGSVVAGAIVVVLLSISWSMKSVEQTAEILHQVTYENLGVEHLKELRVPAELRSFVESLKTMLERLHQAKQRQKRFTEDASHELLTPMALAKSTLQAVRRREHTSEEYILAIDETLKDIERMEKLSHSLLELSRLDNESSPPVLERIRLDEVLTWVGEMFREIAKGAGTELVIGALPTVWILGHRGSLERLFSNLLDNAVKYGPVGRPICVSMVAAEGDRVGVRVHDEGGQIPPGIVKNLFERFYRGDSSQAAPGGHGLGLAISREIAVLHHGDIEIVSELGRGTDVIVYFPKLE